MSRDRLAAILIALSLISLVLFAGPPSCKARVRVSDAPTEATAATKTPATTDVANESPSLPASPVRPSSTFDIPAGLRLPTDSVHVLITDDRGSTEKRQTSEGVGSGARATGGQLNQQIDTSAPGATLGDQSATGGSLASRLRLVPVEQAASNPLLWVGIAAGLAAIACLYFGLRRLAFYLGLAAAAFIAAAMLPKLAVVLICGVALVIGGVLIWSEHNRQSLGTTLETVMRGVEDAPSAVRQETKRFIRKRMDTVPKAVKVIDKLKDQKGILSESDRD